MSLTKFDPRIFMEEIVPIQRALISVSDKSGVVEFANSLSLHGIKILSTGGTARLLQEHDLEVQEVSDFTGSPGPNEG